MQPEPIACLRCGFPRTVRFRDAHVCFQCRFSWPLDQHTARPQPPGAVSAEPVPAYAFTPPELQRLRAYRAAVHAGFYADFFPPPAGERVTTARSSCLSPPHTTP